MNIKVVNYSKIIKGNDVLKNIELSFETGNIYLLEGVNGSGKTMLLRALAGLIIPTEGYIEVDGKKLEKNNFLSDCGVLIGHTELPLEYTGLQNLKIINDIQKKDSIENLEKYMTMMSLDPSDKRKVSQYSMGMRQKLSIAQTFINDPSILLLDEPLNSLDKESIADYLKILSDSKKNKIIIIAAHNAQELKDISNQIIEMDNGKVYEIR